MESDRCMGWIQKYQPGLAQAIMHRQFVPIDQAGKVRQSIFEAGAGKSGSNGKKKMFIMQL